MSPASYVLRLTPNYEQLETMTQHPVGRVAVRAHMDLLSARGYLAYEFAEIYRITRPTAQEWIERFDQEDPEGLYDRERENRPANITEQAEEKLRRVLQATPTKEGYEATHWTTPQFSEHLKQKLSIGVHPETVLEARKRLECGWKHLHRSLLEYPCYAVHILANDHAIAYADAETTRSSSKARPTGEQRNAEVPRQNGKFALCGALDTASGAMTPQQYQQG